MVKQTSMQEKAAPSLYWEARGALFRLTVLTQMKLSCSHVPNHVTADIKLIINHIFSKVSH